MQHLAEWVAEFFASNPLSLLQLIATRDLRALSFSPLDGSFILVHYFLRFELIINT